MSEFIPLSVPEIHGNEWKYVKECLDTGWVSSVGSYVDRFEKMVADYVGTSHAVACASGTAALHVSLIVSGVHPGDEVLTSTLTFIAPANAIRYVGAHPVFVDADEKFWQFDATLARRFLERECERRDGKVFNRRTGRPVTTILPIDALGHPVDYAALRELAEEFSLRIIEDATESLGTKYRGQKVGRLGDLACFSFNGNKIITCGGGGMIVTDNPELAARAKYLSTQAKDDPVEYIHGEIGYNYRLTNVQAAIGCAQMEVLDKHVERKRVFAQRYEEGLKGVPGITPMPEAEWAESSFWMYTVTVDEKAYGHDARGLLCVLEKEKIQSRPLWQPCHLSKPHADSQVLGGSVAERLYRSGLSLPCSPGMTDAQQDRVIEVIRKNAK